MLLRIVSTLQGMEKVGLKTRKEVQEWFAAKTQGAPEDISVIVAGGEPGYSLIWAYDLRAHVTKKVEVKIIRSSCFAGLGASFFKKTRT